MADKRKHISTSGSELESSISEVVVEKQKKKKGKIVASKGKTIPETQGESMESQIQDLKVELKLMSDKLTSFIDKNDSFTKELVTKITTQVKAEIVKPFEKRIEILEAKLFEKELDSDKLNRKIESLENDLKKAKESEQHDKTCIIRVMEKQSGKLNELEQYGRRNNIRIAGLAEASNTNNNNKTTSETAEDTSKAIIKFLNEKIEGLNLCINDIDIAHRLGKRDTNSKPRAAIVKFVSRYKRDQVMKNRRCLKGSGIFVNDDLTKLNQAVLMSIKRKLNQERNETAWSWEGKLYVKTASGTITQVRFDEYSKWTGPEWNTILKQFNNS